jgi:6-bladed beta-propeller
MGKRALVKVPVLLGLLLSFAAGSPVLTAQIPEWTVAPEASVSAGDGSGAGHQLLFVRDALIRTDGSLVVLSAGTKDLRIYSSGGLFMRAVGRQGEGPGEFKTPSGFTLLPSGHLLVYDPGNLRVTEFDEGYEVVGTERVAYSISAMTPAFGRRRPMWNRMVPVAAYDTPMFETVRRDEGIYEDDLVVRLFSGADVQMTVRRRRGQVYQARDGSAGLTLPLPMGEFALFNSGPEHVVLGSSHSNRFDVYDTVGHLVQSVHAQASPRRASSEDMAAFDRKTREERRRPITLRGIQTPSRDKRVERYLKDAPRGDEVPMFDQVEVGEAGHIWVREYLLDQETVSWQVLDLETGGAMARVIVPARWEILRAAPSYLVVLERDEYDVEVVRVYTVFH